MGLVTYVTVIITAPPSRHFDVVETGTFGAPTVYDGSDLLISQIPYDVEIKG